VRHNGLVGAHGPRGGQLGLQGGQCQRWRPRRGGGVEVDGDLLGPALQLVLPGGESEVLPATAGVVGGGEEAVGQAEQQQQGVHGAWRHAVCAI